MRVTCPTCHAVYDDLQRWTICPHNLLEQAYDAPHYNCGKPGYCAGHDLFNCLFTLPPEPPHADTAAARP